MNRILVGFDGSEHARRALQRAGEVATQLRIPVTVLVAAEFVPGAYGLAAPGMIDPTPPLLDTDGYERLVAEGVERVRGTGAPANGRLEWGPAADRILSAAVSEDAALIVLGHRGAGGLESLLAGSVTRRVIDGAHCSVLVVR